MNTYECNDILFNNVKTSGIKLSSGPLIINGLTGTDPDDNSGIINAIDIDWNGAELSSLITNDNIKSKLSNLTINTTSDLLKLIIELANNINVQNEPKNELYFSIGPEEITIDNYTTANNAIKVNEYDKEYYYETNTRQYIYCLISKDKTISLIDPSFNSIIDSIKIESNIPGYDVYKSGVKIGANIYVKILDNENDENTDEDESNNLDNDFYFSVGSEEVTIDNYTTVNNASKVSSYNEINEYSLEERTYLYILVNELKTVNLKDKAFNSEIELVELDTNIPKYKVYKSAIKVGGNIILEIL